MADTNDNEGMLIMGEPMYAWGGGISVPSAQFCCQPITILKKKNSLLEKKNKVWKGKKFNLQWRNSTDTISTK